MVCLPFLSVASLHGFSMLSLQQNILTSYTMACMHAQLLSCVWLFATPWTVAHQAPLSMGFSRQKYWSGLPFPHPGIEHTSLMSPALAGGFFIASTPGKPLYMMAWVSQKHQRKLQEFFKGLSSFCCYDKFIDLFFLKYLICCKVHWVK